MKSIYLFIIVILGLSLSFMSLNTPNNTPEIRKEKWAKIEKNIQNHKEPKTTLKWCNELLKEIEKGNYPDEEVKIKLYINYLNYSISDDSDNLNQNIISELDNDIENLPFPQKNYLAFFAYQLIEKHINNSGWLIKQNTNNNYNPLDINTWKLENFTKKSKEYKTIAFENSKALKEISINNASHLFIIENINQIILNSVYQAFLYLDLELQKRTLYESKISSLDIEDSFSGTCSNSHLQKFIDTSILYRNTFSESIRTRLEMELWAHLISLKSNPKIEDIYLNNLISLNTHNNINIENEKNYRIALHYQSKANNITWQNLKQIEEINKLKQNKTKWFNKTISYLDKIELSKNKRTEEIHNLSIHIKNDITKSTSLNINGKQTYQSNKDLVFDIFSKNKKLLNLEVYKVSPNEYHKIKKHLNWRERNNILAHIKEKNIVWKGNYDIQYVSDYIGDHRQIIIPSLEYGLYAISIKGDQSKALFFQVSDLFIEKDKNILSVKSSRDYSVIKNAILCVGFDSHQCYKFNNQGDLNYKINKNEDQLHSIIHKNDKYYLYNEYLGYHEASNQNNKHFKNEIFTDRAIYRPGQTVHLKVQQKQKYTKDILYTLSNARKLKIELKDTQYELIESKTITLNEFSSGYTNFTLPKDLPNGLFHIVTPHGRESIQVEEYKRPTFFIEFKKDSTEKRIGDIIKIPLRSQTFSGLKLADAKIEYTITYNNMPIAFWRCGYFNWSEPYILDYQKSNLNKEGEFIVEINSNNIPEEMKEQNVVQFSIEAKIIDNNGSSEVETTSFTLSKDGLNFKNLNVYETIEHDDISQNIKLTNFQNIPINKNINYTIWELEQPEHILQSTNALSEVEWLLSKDQKSTIGLDHLPQLNSDHYDVWKKTKQIKSGQFTSNKEETLNLKIPKGIYKIVFSTKDNKGNLITKNQFLRVYPAKGKFTLKDENIYVNTNQNEFRVGETYKATLYLPFNSNYHYILSDYTGILQSGIIKGDKTFKINQDIFSRSKGGLVLDIKTVYNNKLYQYQSNSNVNWDLDLTAKWVHINHKTQPQSKEEWSLEIKDSSNEIPDAEILAFMYDASLDDIIKHDIKNHIDIKPIYNKSKFLKGHRLQAYFRSSLSFNNNSYYNSQLSNLSGIRLSTGLDMIKIGSNNRYNSRNNMLELASPLKGMAMADSDKMENRSNKSLSFESNTNSKAPNIDQNQLNIEGNPANNKSKSIQIRKNFQETIFFYPELRTNHKGIVDIPFNMTDGLGQYKLMLYGYTKDFKQFYLEEDIISNKELMAEMHKPRFLYAGDKLIWTAKISNLSSQAQNVQVQLKITNSLSSELLFQSDQSPNSFLLEAGESKTVSWESTTPKEMAGELQYELRAETEQFVDIEIDRIPILTTQKLINENFALTLAPQQSKTYKLSKLLNSSNYEQFRIECMTNPIWQVIKALPYTESENDNFITNLVDEYISIKIGRDILNKNPEISKRLLSLSKQKQTSELKKKQTLKAITLEESPWLDDAHNQEETMLTLSNFFNKNNLDNRIKTIERKIRNHQNLDGGFSWIKGGRDSYSMSLYVGKSLSNLEKLGIESNNLNNLKNKLFNYLDAKILNRYKRLHQNNNLNHVKIAHIPYLEIRTIFLGKFDINKESLVAYNFFLERSLKHWTEANFNQRISLSKIAFGNGEIKISEDIFKTINEYSISSSEYHTIYWKQLANGLSWQNRKLVNHADIIHLYSLHNRPESEIQKLQNWLLQQKRSQYWGNSSETSQLIYALLLNVNDTNIFEKPRVDIKLNGQSIHFALSEGWLSKTWLKNQNIDLAKASIEVINSSNHPIWVSGYQQYFSHISEVKAEKKSDCIINKTFYKLRIIDLKKEWIKTDLKDLKVGDEIKINMALTTPQQLDFVYLQDYFGGCLEPTEQISGFKYDRMGSYYLNIKDQKMQFFFDHLARGTHEFEFKTTIIQAGDFANGFSEFQSYYAPEFGGHSESGYIQVVK